MIVNGVMQELADSGDAQEQFLKESNCKSFADYAAEQCKRAPHIGRLDVDFIEHPLRLEINRSR